MTEDDAQEIFAQLNVARILVAIVESAGQISVPVNSFINAVNEDKELQVDYNKDDQTFSFKLRSKEDIGESI